MLNQRRLLVTVLFVVLGSVRCASEEPEARPVLPLTVAEGPELPQWALGSFTRHAGDVWYLQIEADGTALHYYAGGDVGGDTCGRARVDGGEVVVLFGEKPVRLEQDARGRMFVDGEVLGTSDSAQRAYERGALCGREGGGCGGYERVEACDAREVARYDALVAECRNSSGDIADAGVDAR